MPFSRLLALFHDHRTVFYIGISTFLLTLGQGAAILAVPLYANSLGFATAQVGLAVSAFATARFLTNVPAAIISDRIGRRGILIGGALFAALGNVLSSYADTLSPLLIFRFIAGIGSGAFITVGIVAIADISTSMNRARLMSFFQGSFIAGIALGPMVGGIIADLIDLRAPFIFVGIVSTLSAAWTLWILPETRGRRAQLTETGDAAPTQPREDPYSGNTGPVTYMEEAGARRFSFMLRRGYLLILLIFAGVFFSRGGALFTVMPIKAKNDLALSSSEVGLLLTLASLATLFVLPFVGTISDRYGRKSIIVPGMILLALCLAILGLSSTAWLFGIGMIMYGITQGMEGPPPLAYVSDVTPAHRQALGQGMARTVGDLALLGGAPIMGRVTDIYGSTDALLGNAVIIAIIMVVFLVFARETAGRQRAGSTIP